ncbi:MAG: hypothetical protein AAF628_26925 [Planctomycetota bacterium]
MQSRFEGPIGLEIAEMPAIELKSIDPPKESSWLERFAIATRRRFFTMQRDWSIELFSLPYAPALQGTVRIPKDLEGKRVEFDGASIPLPWLVSLMTIGVLRPLGVMLVGSIIHDFAFRYGFLLVRGESGEEKRVEMPRHVADALLRDTISTFNRTPVIAWFGWLFVRFGWLFVPYAGKRWAGRWPIVEVLLVLGGAFAVGWAVWRWPMWTLSVSAAVYFSLYLLSALTLRQARS